MFGDTPIDTPRSSRWRCSSSKLWQKQFPRCRRNNTATTIRLGSPGRVGKIKIGGTRGVTLKRGTSCARDRDNPIHDNVVTWGLRCRRRLLARAASGPATAPPSRAMASRAPHSITSSARPSSGKGIVRPSVLAVFRLMANSTLVDCTTGSSAGFSPFRIRPVYVPASR